MWVADDDNNTSQSQNNFIKTGENFMTNTNSNQNTLNNHSK